MKFFACIVFAAIFAVAASEEVVGSSYGMAPSYGHEVHAGPAKTYTYPSPAPHVPCGKNLLFSCSPSVAPVPCSAPSYGHSAPSYGHSAPSY